MMVNTFVRVLTHFLKVAKCRLTKNFGLPYMKMTSSIFSDDCAKESNGKLPQWSIPSKEGKLITGLMIHNSLTHSKVEFVPQKANHVYWYGCGPTVYDAAHMGHARTYLSFDIIRRIMNDYLNYDVFMVMNITDIDDKIIKRSHEEGVYFLDLAKHWENEFWKDMKSLNIQYPSAVTRVSEYIPKILEFIKKIIENGYAYVSEGSVYFDTKKFASSPTHFYGRMEPTSVNDQSRAMEGEGELTILGEKKNSFDFSLWKKTKEGEPSWESEWGRGRPGWHIECSVMASSILGFPIDIHSGGIDLRFPHHDNELAQSEACYDKPHWVNYFLHTGHLHIHGSKMSKSLKNFITIKEILKQFNARHLRISYLINMWDSFMNYNPGGETMKTAVDIDKIFINFFALVKTRLKTVETDSCKSEFWTEDEIDLSNQLRQTKQKVHEALLNNFNTADVILKLQNLVSSTNNYINKRDVNELRASVVMDSALYVFRILRMLGVTAGNENEFEYEYVASMDSEIVEPLITSLAKFRGSVRENIHTIKKMLSNDELNIQQIKCKLNDILISCDTLRDMSLPDIGIHLQDAQDGSFTIRRTTREDLLKEKERKNIENQCKRELRDKSNDKPKHSNAEIKPSEYFKELFGSKYSIYDDDGIPTHFSDGTEIPKSHRKTLIKMIEKHKTIHNNWLDEKKEKK